ncbi:MAG: arylesterase [Geobacteraceae bacterium]|nr:arylesterase [Geobacteraceae bacterium]
MHNGRCHHSWRAEGECRAEGTIVAVGDSLTAGFGVAAEDSYPALLERKLRDAGHAFRVVNAGINGEKSGEALERVGRILELQPDIVILQTGTNDGLRNVPPQEMKGNIRAIVRELSQQGVTVVLAGMRNLKPRKGDYDELFARAYPEIAEEEGIILIPLFLEGVAGVPGLNRADGIHPTEEGYRIIAETVYPFVQKALERARG